MLLLESYRDSTFIYYFEYSVPTPKKTDFIFENFLDDHSIKPTLETNTKTVCRKGIISMKLFHSVLITEDLEYYAVHTRRSVGGPNE